MRRAAVLVCVAALVASACGGDDAEGEDELSATTTAPLPTDDLPLEDGGAPLAEVELALTEVAQADSPTALADRPDSTVAYVAERPGRVRPLAGDDLGDPVLDISDDVVTDAEQGLLGIEFSPDGDTLYVSYSLAPEGHTRVDAYAMDGDAADAGSRREVLAVDQPLGNHNGGDIAFGPDGFLYVALGDGGGAGDPQGNGQDPQTLLGSILRIDPDAADDGGYGIPEDNPFVDGQDGAPEVWLYGVRNPWRISFDAETGDLWVADVGQSAFEEVNLLAADDGGGSGENLGWNEMEGAHPYEGGSNPEGAVLPLFEYDHGEGGCSITGGYVYRGTAIPELTGAYVFTDYCDGRIRGLRAVDGAVTEEEVFAIEGTDLVSFGEDAEGELYVLSLDGTISRIEAA
jgi:glucose/arabinose dehydrogenase